MSAPPSTRELVVVLAALGIGLVLFFAGGTIGIKLIGMWIVMIVAGVDFWRADGPLVRQVKRRFRNNSHS